MEIIIPHIIRLYCGQAKELNIRVIRSLNANVGTLSDFTDVKQLIRMVPAFLESYFDIT